MKRSILSSHINHTVLSVYLFSEFFLNIKKTYQIAAFSDSSFFKTYSIAESLEIYYAQVFCDGSIKNIIVMKGCGHGIDYENTQTTGSNCKHT